MKTDHRNAHKRFWFKFALVATPSCNFQSFFELTGLGSLRTARFSICQKLDLVQLHWQGEPMAAMLYVTGRLYPVVAFQGCKNYQKKMMNVAKIQGEGFIADQSFHCSSENLCCDIFNNQLHELINF